MIARLIRIDARRPASWIAAVAAAVVAVAMPASGGPLAAVACGGLLAVAAAGDLLAVVSGGELGVVRTIARAAWPLAGLVAAGPIMGWPGGSFACGAALVGGLIAVLAGIALVSAVRRRLPWARWSASFPLPGGSRAESWADRLAMASMLAAMAVCYFLVPELAGWYAVVASAWLVLLAVPRATLWGGDAAGRRQLVGSAAGRPRPPGTVVHTARALAGSVGLLGWPAVVALALQRTSTWSNTGPAAAIALLVALAALATAMAAVAAWRRLPADTPLAVTAAVFAISVARIAQVP